LSPFENYIERLKKAFQNPLPGIDAQFLMAPSGRKEFMYPGVPEKAAVLLLIYPKNQEPHIVFIKRPEYPGAHSNQISFPGGKYEQIDSDLKTTAIRETIEELGDKLDNIEIIGKLTPLLIPVSGFEVHPFVGSINYKPIWNPDPKEVLYILESSIRLLNNPETKKIETWNFKGADREVPFYKINKEKIWGATAMILSEYETITIN
jgi:8-oxo-dGTP pyrophosphatase MutT (NUDIX family)